MRSFFECLWETITTILLILFLAVAMFPLGLFLLSSLLFR